jgi:hypothetical protein
MKSCWLMSTICPSCRATISIADINVSTDIALCRSCGKTFSFSEIVPGVATVRPDLAAPPAGTWFEELPRGFRVGGSTRSWMALVIVPFTCVWSGGSLGGIYGSQIKSGHFDLHSSLFGVPFLIGSFFLVGMCAMTAAGKIELVQSEERLKLFMGVGRLGWSRTFTGLTSIPSARIVLATASTGMARGRRS